RMLRPLSTRTWNWTSWIGLMMATMLNARTPEPLPPARTDLNAEIIKAADVYRHAIIAGDAKAVAATYRDDAPELGPCGPPLTSRTAIEAHYQRMFQNLKVTSFKFTHL